jgi:hypothetical protein
MHRSEQLTGEDVRPSSYLLEAIFSQRVAGHKTLCRRSGAGATHSVAGIPRGPRNVLERAGSVSRSRAHAMSGCASLVRSYRDAASPRVIASLMSSPDRLWLIVRFASWRSWRLVRCRGRGPLRLCIGGLVDVSSGCEVSMDERNDRRSFAAGGCDAFHRAGAGVADGEHAGYGGGEAFGGKPVGP